MSITTTEMDDRSWPTRLIRFLRARAQYTGDSELAEPRLRPIFDGNDRRANVCYPGESTIECRCESTGQRLYGRLAAAGNLLHTTDQLLPHGQL